MKYVKVYDCVVMQDIPDVVVFNSQKTKGSIIVVLVLKSSI